MEERNELKELAEAVNAVTVNNIKSEINNIYNAIENNPEEDIKAKIPIQVFDTYFLPYFVEDFLQGRSTYLTSKWIELSGSPYKEVDVVDMNGNVILTVPGLYLRPNIENESLQKKNFSNIAETYRLKNKRLPSEATAYLLKELSDVPSMVEAEVTDDIKLKWSKIVNRYYEVVLKTTNPSLEKLNTATNMNNISVDESLDIEYD